MVTRVIAKKTTHTARSAAQKVQKNVTDAVVGSLGLHGERMSKVDTAWLRMDSASNLMNSFHDTAPCPHLFVGMNPWGIDVPFAHRRDLCRLGHDKSSGSAL